MKIAYVAEDGTQFNSEFECLEHESHTTLYGHIKNNIGRKYDDDVGFSIIEPENVEQYIAENFETIKKLIKAYATQ